MNINRNVIFIIISCFFFSCEVENNIHYYHKNFFLGETNFLIEGTAVNFDTSIIAIISAGKAHYNLDIYSEYSKGWQISSGELSENKFEILINVTANGVTLNSELLLDGVIKPMGFPNEFPSCYLVFRPLNCPYSYQQFYTYSKIDEIKYNCTFVYVAEPADLTGTEVIDILQWQGDKSKLIRNDIHHYDYNFTKSGWYKIVNGHNEPVSNDHRHSSVSDIYFYDPDYEY